MKCYLDCARAAEQSSVDTLSQKAVCSLQVLHPILLQVSQMR